MNRPSAAALRPAVLSAWLFAAPLFAQPTAFGESDGKYSEPMPIRRYALVVGVGDYEYIDKVRNATNDAQLVAATLARPELGFDEIKVLRDEEADTKEQIIQAAADLAKRADVPNTAATVVFYFAGHGYQVDNVNYLAPRKTEKVRIDPGTRMPDKRQLQRDGLPIALVLAALQTGRRPGVTILLLDACRTNIYTSGAAHPPQESPEGFHAVKTEDSQKAVLSFATRFGDPAKSESRHTRGNSPYAAALTELIVHEGVPLTTVLVSLKSLVDQFTDKKQMPDEVNASAAGTHFYFHRGGLRIANERSSWLKVRDMTRKECVEDYLHHYPDGYYAQQAMKYVREEPPSAADGGRDGRPCVLVYP